MLDEMGELIREVVMRSQHDNIVAWYRFMAVIFASVVLLGCEETQEQRELTVTPNAAALSQAGDRVVLTASVPDVSAAVTNSPSGLLYPLEWRVTDPVMGRIISTTANVAVYQCDIAGGVNLVIVRDRSDREGLANINWDDPESEEDD
jgi:hypothetical protein